MSAEKVMEQNYEDSEVMFQIINENAKQAKRRRYEKELEAENAQLRKQLRNIEMRKRTNILNIFKGIEYIIASLSVLFLLWVFLSWVNVITHNIMPGQADLIGSWNFFKVFF